MPDQAPPHVRKGQDDVKLSREEFERRLKERFYDPAFDAAASQIQAVVDVAWKTYDEYHKSPRTRKAGPGFADPEFALPIAANDAVDVFPTVRRDARADDVDRCGLKISH